jgi:hypothetical protein
VAGIPPVIQPSDTPATVLAPVAHTEESAAERAKPSKAKAKPQKKRKPVKKKRRRG